MDLASPRLVDFEHTFPEQRSARSFAREVRPAVQGINEFGGQHESLLSRFLNRVAGKIPEFEAQCKVRMVPTHEAITATETKLAETAKRFGGEPDGWGFMSNPDGSPVDP